MSTRTFEVIDTGGAPVKAWTRGVQFEAGAMEQVRGVSVDGVIQTLLDRGLVEQVGRAEVVGRPATYGTTPVFLEYFGIRSLDEMPAADELRRIPVEKPPLATADPGLATAPPEELALNPDAPKPADDAGDGARQVALDEGRAVLARRSPQFAEGAAVVCVPLDGAEAHAWDARFGHRAVAARCRRSTGT